MEKKEVIAQLMNDGATPVKNLKVKNVTVTPMENYVRIALTLTTPVKGMVIEDDGVTYKVGETNVIFISLYSVASILKDDDNAAFAVNHLMDNPKSMEVILSRAVVNILQQKVEKGIPYKNPWSESADETTFDHDVFINHLTDIKLSDIAIKRIDKIADSLLGI